jgi:hypothetical protein
MKYFCLLLLLVAGEAGIDHWVWLKNPKSKMTAAGAGNGDQRLFIDKKHGLVAAVTAGCRPLI